MGQIGGLVIGLHYLGGLIDRRQRIARHALFRHAPAYRAPHERLQKAAELVLACGPKSHSTGMYLERRLGAPEAIGDHRHAVRGVHLGLLARLGPVWDDGMEMPQDVRQWHGSLHPRHVLNGVEIVAS